MYAFKAFVIKVFAVEKGTVGELAKQIKFDKGFPNRSENKKEVYMYLDYNKMTDSTEKLKAFDDMWKVYEGYKKMIKSYEQGKE